MSENQIISKEEIKSKSKVLDPYVILGEQKEIAYTVVKMQNAVDYINLYKNHSQFIGKIINPTHYYVKFIPNNEDHLNILEHIENDSIVLSCYPLDYEIIQEGSFLEKSNDEDIKFSELYTTVPLDFSFPNVPYEILEELYKPTEEEYEIDITALVLNDEEDILEDFLVNGEPISKFNLIDFLNLPDDGSNEKGGKYTPYGYFKVWNTETSNYVAVRNTKISYGRSVWWYYTYTNSSGKFTSHKTYRGTVNIRAKWKSESATIRKHWNELLGIGVSDFLMKIKKSTNGKTYNTSHSDNHKWYKATVQNAIIKYNSYIEPKGVNGVHGANIWVWESNSTQGMTPMLHKYIWTTTNSVFFNSLLVYTGFTGVQIINLLNLLFGQLYPDMILNYSNKDTKLIDQLLFHEAGHFSHSLKTGGWEWGQFVGAELDNILATINTTQDPYRDGHKPTKEKGKRIALAEGWATFTEYAVMNGYYTTDIHDNSIVPYMENFNMYVTPNVIYDDNDSWFLTGLIWDIIDDSTESGSELINNIVRPPLTAPIIDNLHRGNITGWYAPVYERLNSNVDDGYDLKTALKNAYPSDIYLIDQLFISYGYHK